MSIFSLPHLINININFQTNSALERNVHSPTSKKTPKGYQVMSMAVQVGIQYFSTILSIFITIDFQFLTQKKFFLELKMGYHDLLLLDRHGG